MWIFRPQYVPYIQPHPFIPLAPAGAATGTGAASLSSLITAGSGGSTFTGTGAASLTALVGAGSGSFATGSTGAAALSALVAAGTGSFTTTATGAASLTAYAAAGVAGSGVFGTGAASLAALVARSHVPWLNTAWLYRQPITVDNGLNATSALSYYQASVSLTGAAYTSFAAHAKADGSDLRVTDSDGVTLLSFALEGIDTANSTVYLLVKVPFCAAAASKTLYVYYGNTAATSVSSYATTVGPTTAIVGPTDVADQTDFPGFYEAPRLVYLQHQDQANGGGAGLNGRLLLFASVSETGNGAGGQSVGMKTSTDGGVTFTTPVTLLAPAASHTASFISATEYHDGTLYLLYGYALTTDYAAGHSTNYIAKSTDGGATWTNLSTTPAGNRMATPWALGTDLGAFYGRFTETPNGDLYVGCYAKLAANTGWSSWLMKCPAGSDPTNGSNWAQVGVIAFDNVNFYSESATLNTGGSNWLAITRNSLGTGPGDLYRSTSTDGGATWSAATAMGLPGVGVESPNHNNAVSPSLLPLASGNILLSWGVRYGSFYGVACMLSTDGGVTYDDRQPVMPYALAAAGMNTPSFGYPHAVQLPNGNIVLVSFHQITAGVLSTTNVTRQIFTEDWVCNSGNIYESCESFTANFSAHGANATLSATHVHNGSNAVKFDNTAATGGTNDYVMMPLWSANTAQQTGKIAVSAWNYVTANDTQAVFKIMDVNAVFTSISPRTQADIWGSNLNHVEWFNGTAWQDTGTPAPQNQWNKLTLAGNIQPSTMTGGRVRLNNTSLSPALGQYATGAAPRFLQMQGASVASTHNVIFWVDDVYTHQYTANAPITAAGTEQTYSAPPTFTAPSTGTASLAALTALGAGAFTTAGLGAASLVALVAAGSAGSGVFGSGAASLTALTALGTGAFTARGTGAASLVTLVAAGAGTFSSTGGGGDLLVYPDPFGATVVMTADPFGSTALVAIDPFTATAKRKGN